MDALADQYHISLNDHKHKAMCGSGVIEGAKVLLAKPLTYMNLSGDSVAEIINFYKLDPENEMIVIFDDISLAPGNIRVRKKGSAGGHNGIKSIIARCGTQNFMRIKVGVGEKPEGWDLADHVLGRFSNEDRALVEDAKVNSQVNGIDNTSFFAGDMKDILTHDFIAEHGQPDVIITDPPREGMHPDVIKVIMNAAPKRIVYVSCNPATQARDLQLLDPLYKVA